MDKREILKQILRGSIGWAAALKGIETNNQFNLHGAVYELASGDIEIMRFFYPDRYPAKA